MNGRIKIFSKANMLGQNLTLAVVLLITVFLSLVFNNSFVLGQIIADLPRFGELFFRFGERVVKITFFSVLGILSYIALAPFKFGREIWFFENAKKTRLPVKNLFAFYSMKKSLNTIKFILFLQLKKMFVTFLFLLPSLIIGGYIVYSLSEGIGKKMLISLFVSSVLLFLSGLFFSFVFVQRYFLAGYIFYENDRSRVKDIINLSVKVMENKCFETAFLKISFVGWFLLCLLVFPTFYVYPFYKLSISAKALSLLANTENNT